MKLSDIEYGEKFSYAVGETSPVNCMKSNRVEGGLRLCINTKGEVIDLPEDWEVNPFLPLLEEE